MPKESTNEPGQDETESNRKGNWAEDQEERGYYYDDAHGYEKYIPEEEEDEEQPEGNKSYNDLDQ